MIPTDRKINRPISVLLACLDNSASGGLLLMATAAAALFMANSSFAPFYFKVLHTGVGPLSVQHWINDAFMSVFFLLVGLEIKREVLDGQLSTWNRRILPGVAATGGMIAPAIIFLIFNGDDPAIAKGWAIPAATDIAFALGILALLGSRVPTSLKVFLTALAIIDDLGAVLIIAAFYTNELSLLDLGLAGIVVGVLIVLNRLKVMRLWLYMLLGILLWYFVFHSGIHATIAGVVLALTIPMRCAPAKPDQMTSSLLHQLEHKLHYWVAFLIIPIFGFANAGVSFDGLTSDVLTDRLTLGVAFGLLLGKLIGVFGSAALAIRLGFADMPKGANIFQLLGISVLCGVGFTMSLFIGMLAFPHDPTLQEQAKVGILGGSILAGLIGWAILRIGCRNKAASHL